jgi:mannose-6-phosphate isomerase-like protein (cupin superfamily)
MKAKERLSEFYTRHQQDFTATGQFNVYRREEFACDATSLPPNRRDFYKVSLILEGEGVVLLANKKITIKGNTITFMNPSMPYAWEPYNKHTNWLFLLV